MSIMPVVKRRRPAATGRPVCWDSNSARAATIPRPIGIIMAVVAVLLIHMEMSAQMAPKKKRIRAELEPTKRQERMP